MTLCVKRPEDERGDTASKLTSEHRRIDVTDMHAAGVQEYVRDRVRTDDVSLEHRGARTYLVIGE